MGAQSDIFIAPGLVNHPDKFKGMVVTLVRTRNQKRQGAVEKVVAAGGRYDHLIREFKRKLSFRGGHNHAVSSNSMEASVSDQAGVGISLILDQVESITQSYSVDFSQSRIV